MAQSIVDDQACVRWLFCNDIIPKAIPLSREISLLAIIWLRNLGVNVKRTFIKEVKQKRVNNGINTM